MAEGVAAAGQVLAGAVHDDPDSPPPAGPEAPKGWAWQRGSKSWAPRQRGPVLWTGEDGIPKGSVFVGHEEGPPEPGRDPGPSWRREGAEDQPPLDDSGSDPDDVPQDVQDDIAGLAGLVATPILALAKAVDPYCGGALADNFEGIFDATLPLMLRSKKLVRYFSEDHNDWLVWGKLAMALAPVGKAIVEHHVFRTVETVRDEETGQRYVRPRQRESQHGDHLTPAAQPEAAPFDYAA